MSGSSALSRHATRLAAALAAGTLALALAACGTENKIDQDSVEEGVLSLAPPEAGAESADCPDDVSSDVGTVFECIVTTTENGEVPVEAEVTSEGEDDVEFEITSVDGVDVPGQ